MPKYLMFKHYRGPRVPEIAPEQWSPEDWQAHMAYMEGFAERLRGSGEFVTSIALSDEGEWVRHSADGQPPESDGPLEESKELVAGLMIIDVADHDRALSLAGELSAAPGPGGGPLREWLELRPVMGD